MKRFCALLLTICLALALCPGARAGDFYGDAILNGKDGTVTLYKKASAGGGTVGTFCNGVTVEYYTEEYSLKSQWLEVTIEGRGVEITGYVRGSDLTDGYVETAPHTYAVNTSVVKTYPAAEVAEDGAAVYGGAGRKAGVVGRLYAGVPVYVLGDCGDRYFISVAGALTHGFMDKSALRLTGGTGADDAEIAPITEGVVYASDEPGQNIVPMYETCAKYREPPSRLYDGDAVSVLGQWGDWALVAKESSWYGKIGFVESRFLDEQGDHSLTVLYVRTDKPNNRLLLRSRKDETDDYNGKFFPGVPVIALTEQDEWNNNDFTYVSVGGQFGYFKNEYLLTLCDEPLRYATLTETVTVNRRSSNEFTLPKGARAALLGSRDADMYALTADGRFVELPIDCLTPENDNYAFIAKVSASSLKMREAPDEDGAVMRSISQNTSVRVLLHGDVWSQIEYKGGVGYVMTRYLKY